MRAFAILALAAAASVSAKPQLDSSFLTATAGCDGGSYSDYSDCIQNAYSGDLTDDAALCSGDSAIYRYESSEESSCITN